MYTHKLLKHYWPNVINLYGFLFKEKRWRSHSCLRAPVCKFVVDSTGPAWPVLCREIVAVSNTGAANSSARWMFTAPESQPSETKQGQLECTLKTQKLLKAENAGWVLHAADIGRVKASWCHVLCLGTGFEHRARNLLAPTTKESWNGNGNTMKTN